MSVATDLRTRAEDVLDHSKQVLAQAQTRIKSDERFTTMVGKAESAYGNVSDAVSGHVIKPAKELIAKSPLAGKFGSAPAAPVEDAAISSVTPLKKPVAKKPVVKSAPAATDGDGADSIKE